MKAKVNHFAEPTASAGTIQVTADQVTLSNGSLVDTGAVFPAPAGHITFNAGTFSASDSIIASRSVDTAGGAITIQGLQGSGTNPHAVSLTNTVITTDSSYGSGGAITIRGDNISMNQIELSSFSSRRSGGTIDLQAEKTINVTDTFVNASASSLDGGSGGPVTLSAASITLNGGRIATSGQYGGGLISITGKKVVSFSNNTFLTADGNFVHGGTILINGGALLTSQQSSISAGGGSGGTIHMEANKVVLTDSQLNTSVSHSHLPGQEPAGGTITVDAKNLTLNNSQILSTSPDGHGGIIDITTKALHRDGSTVIDASSQFGTNGTVIINGVVQP